MAKAKTKKDKAGIILDGGVSVSKAFVLDHKSEAEFLEAMNGKEYAHILEGDKKRAQKLGEVYALAQPKDEVKAAPAKGAKP